MTNVVSYGSDESCTIIPIPAEPVDIDQIVSPLIFRAHVKSECLPRQYRCGTSICLDLCSSISASRNPPTDCPRLGVLTHDCVTCNRCWLWNIYASAARPKKQTWAE